jgi:hypothetical protein
MIAFVDLIVKLPVLRVVKVLNNEVDEFWERCCPSCLALFLRELIDIIHIVPETHTVKDCLGAHTFLIIIVHILF